MAEFPTSIGTSDVDTITLIGRDLSTDLIGRVSFGELAYSLITLRLPTPGELRLFEAVLVALADHGLTPTAIAARLTLYGAPDAVQGAIAAGLLGGGSRLLGVTEDTGRFLGEVLDRIEGPMPETDDEWDALACVAVQRCRADGRLVPGLGHPVHKHGDPRVAAIEAVAREAGVAGPHLALFAAVGRVHAEVLGRTLPLNGAGVCGAALADLGLPAELLRGVALLARCAGLLGHLAEEQRRPISEAVYRTVDGNARYVPPTS
jgi:citrate synthase